MGKNIRNYQNMLSTNMTEQEKLNSLLSQKMSELDERERTINELQDMINAQTERVQNLLNSVKDALLQRRTDRPRKRWESLCCHVGQTSFRIGKRPC